MERSRPTESDPPHPSFESPERFDPSKDAGKLVHAEHVARYLWAAELSPGRTVLDAGCGTGYGAAILAKAKPARLVAIDISEAAVSETASRVGPFAEVSQADVCELPFGDATFDLIVCFEVIEHVQDSSRAVKELARVLRPDGALLVSSPNPRVYPPGNPHHVHEFVPEELRAVLERHFAAVALGGQYAWLGSLVASNDELRSFAGSPQSLMSQVLENPKPQREATYTLAVAGQRSAELPTARMVVGEAFEVKWWMEQVESAGVEARQQAAAAGEEAAEARDRMTEAVRQQGMLAARAQQMEVTLRSAEKRIVDLEQEYAQAVVRTDEYQRAQDLVAEQQKEIAALRERVERADRVVVSLQDSFSWKVTSPLRWIKQVAKRAGRHRGEAESAGS